AIADHPRSMHRSKLVRSSGPYESFIQAEQLDVAELGRRPVVLQADVAAHWRLREGEGAFVDLGVEDLLAVAPDLHPRAHGAGRVMVPFAGRLRRVRGDARVAVEGAAGILAGDAGVVLGLQLQASPRGPVEAAGADDPLVEHRGRQRPGDGPGAEEDPR